MLKGIKKVLSTETLKIIFLHNLNWGEPATCIRRQTAHIRCRDTVIFCCCKSVGKQCLHTNSVVHCTCWWSQCTGFIVSSFWVAYKLVVLLVPLFLHCLLVLFLHCSAACEVYLLFCIHLLYLNVTAIAAGSFGAGFHWIIWFVVFW